MRVVTWWGILCTVTIILLLVASLLQYYIQDEGDASRLASLAETRSIWIGSLGVLPLVGLVAFSMLLWDIYTLFKAQLTYANYTISFHLGQVVLRLSNVLDSVRKTAGSVAQKAEAELKNVKPSIGSKLMGYAVEGATNLVAE